MYHYVTLFWEDADPAARETAAQLEQKLRRFSTPWHCQLSARGITVFSLPPEDPALQPYTLRAGSAVILGALFTADPSNPQPVSSKQLDGRATQEILRTAGNHLVQSFWGGYVAFFRDDESRCAYAIRDCSGKIPCYYTQHGEVTIVFSDIADLAGLELPPFTINWNYIAAFIY